MRAPALTCLLLLSCALPLAAQTVTVRQGGADLKIAVGDAAVMPAGFPADVFVPQDARLLRVERAGDDRLTLGFACGGTPAALAASARDAMLRQGWRQARVAAPAGALAQAWEKDARAVVILAEADGDGSRLTLQLLPRRPAPGPGP
jgi:hypothetical protein